MLDQPLDLDVLRDAYTQTVRSVIDLAAGLRAGDGEVATDCPGWTVLDQVRHIESVESMLNGEPMPDRDVRAMAHVRHDFGAAIERYVDSRRGMDADDLVSALQQALDLRLAFYYGPEVTEDTPTIGPFGETTVGDLLRLRIFDIWTHEQDIREALERPGGLDTGAAAVAVRSILRALPKVVARDAGLAPGTAVIVDVTGPLVGRGGVRVEAGDGGRTVGVPLFTGGSTPHEDSTVTSISLSTAALGRLGAGRRPVADVRWTVTGDEQVARRVLGALSITP